jgi:gluconokinase
VLRLLENFVGPSRRIHASGGFAHSGFLRQLLADIFARPVVIPESVESSCLGAAVLGLYALEIVPSLDVISSMVGTTGELQPQSQSVAIYRQLIPVYAQVLEALQREYETIARFQAQLTPGY